MREESNAGFEFRFFPFSPPPLIPLPPLSRYLPHSESLPAEWSAMLSCFSTSVFHPVMLPSVETVIIHPHEVVTRIFVRWWIFIGGELCLYFRISFNKLSFASPNRPFLEPVLRLNSVPILSHNRGERSDNINLG